MTDVLIPEPQSPIELALLSLEHDAGALYAPSILEQLCNMRSKEPAAFACLRIQVKETKRVNMAEFDRLTATSKTNNSPGPDIFTKVEPWPDPVEGAGLLDDITHALARHVIADKETLRTAALWVTFTWLIDVVQVAPIANITAPEKRCGKSVLLSALSRLVYRPMQISSILPATLFRAIELWGPTLLIDEVDSFLAAHEELRGLINAGITRDGAKVLRCVGEDHTPTLFSVWGAKALCGIGKIADTLADRSIPLRLRRKLLGEKVENLRHSDPALWKQLRSKLARFALDSAERIAKARPAAIPGLNDRANDCWEPLLAIADLAGGHWPRSARNAAITLHGLEGESPSIGVELLGDVKAVFEEKKTIFSADLLAGLIADEEAPWATWNKGRAMSPRQLSARLADYGIKSKDVRQGSEVKKGYHLEQFTDAFGRYLSADTPSPSATPLQPSNHAASSVEESATTAIRASPSATRKATAGEGCSRVADMTPQPQREGLQPTWDDHDEEVI